MPKINYPECGKIINTHGCRGGVKIEPWCDSPEVLAALPVVYMKQNGELVPKKVKKASVFRSFVFAELAGVETMEAAEALIGAVLYAARADLQLPEGAVLVAELAGLPVFHAESGEQLGRLREVISPGARDIYVIDTPRGEGMVPAVAEFVKEVDLERGVRILPIEGMLP